MKMKNGAIGKLSLAKGIYSMEHAITQELVMILSFEENHTTVYWVNGAKKERIVNERIQSFTGTKLKAEVREVLTKMYKNYTLLLPIQKKKSEIQSKIAAMQNQLQALHEEERAIFDEEARFTQELPSITQQKIDAIVNRYRIGHHIDGEIVFSKYGNNMLEVTLSKWSEKYVSENSYSFLYTEYDGTLEIQNYKQALNELAPSIPERPLKELQNIENIAYVKKMEGVELIDKNRLDYTLVFQFKFKPTAIWDDVETGIVKLCKCVSTIEKAFS